MGARGWGRLLAVVLLGAALVACSPEASRTRGGGPGADIGNHTSTVQLHGDASPEQRMFYQTPEKEKRP